MATEELYRQRAKEAREKAAATGDDLRRLVWLEIARGLSGSPMCRARRRGT
jgi:hypothetical protein